MNKSSVTLRQAKQSDLYFLFVVSTLAMLPVRRAGNPELRLDLEHEFREYSKKFDPNAIQIIGYEGQDVGRLRVVRSTESIYIGGIQILEGFQGRGIGTNILRALIDEARTAGVLVTLEVSKNNPRARKLYEGLGFEIVNETGSNFEMEFRLNTP